MNANFEDIKFALSEVERFRKGEWRAKSAAEKQELFYYLPHPSGSGILPCGSRAYFRISDCAARGVRNSQFDGRVDVEFVARELRRGVVHRFIKKGLTLDVRQADRAVSAAIRNASRRITDQTHLIPCNLAQGSQGAEIKMGPVKFWTREERWPDVRKELQQYVEIDTESSTKDDHKHQHSMREMLAKDAEKYYQGFGWIAEVSVKDCDPTISKRRAQRIVSSGLDCLRLLIGAHGSNRMHMGGVGGTQDRRSHIAFDTVTGLQISGRWSGRQNTLADSWWQEILDRGGRPIANLMGQALEFGHDIPAPRPLARKFMDAAHWYGEAVHDDNPAASIIKFIIAVEVILITTKDPGEKIADTVSRRGAAFAYREKKPVEALYKEIKQIYGLRSRLAHGTLPPGHPDVSRGISKASSLAQMILLGVLFNYGEEGLRVDRITDEKIGEAYEMIATAAQRHSRDRFSSTD